LHSRIALFPDVDLKPALSLAELVVARESKVDDTLGDIVQAGALPLELAEKSNNSMLGEQPQPRASADRGVRLIIQALRRARERAQGKFVRYKHFIPALSGHLSTFVRLRVDSLAALR